MKNANWMKVLAALVLLSSSVQLFADDDYYRQRATKSYDVKEFNQLEVNIPCDVLYKPSQKSKLEISGYSQDVLDKIVVEVVDGRLVLKLDAVNILKSQRSVKVYVGSKKLNALKVNGSADFEAINGIVCDDEFKLQVNGSADVDIDILRVPQVNIMTNGTADVDISGMYCDQVDLQINGAGDCELEGRAKLLNVKINGAGDVDISNLRTDKVNSSIRGAGSVR